MSSPSKPKDATDIDFLIADRLRFHRMQNNLSQERLGAMLGLSFAQVQKYEYGTNRLCASRLYEISKILGVPMEMFFEPLSLGQMMKAVA